MAEILTFHENIINISEPAPKILVLITLAPSQGSGAPCQGSDMPGHLYSLVFLACTQKV